MYFSFDESAEVRAWGTALHIVYDVFWTYVITKAPRGTSLTADKYKGFIKIVSNERGLSHHAD